MDGLGETLGAESEVSYHIKKYNMLWWFVNNVVSLWYVILKDPHIRS